MTGTDGTGPDGWVGRTMAELCRALGNPDSVAPASGFGVKLRDAAPSVVLTYHALGHHWFVSEQAVVVAAVRIKE
jgi:hypothetical protein